LDFRWNEWNTRHVLKHGVGPQEAERVVLCARAPFPQRRDADKMLVWGPGLGGRPWQVIFVLDPDDRVFVIHARPLTEAEKRRCRRRHRP